MSLSRSAAQISFNTIKWTDAYKRLSVAISRTVQLASELYQLPNCVTLANLASIVPLA